MSLRDPLTPRDATSSALPRDQAHPVWLFDAVCVLCSRGVLYTVRKERPCPEPQRIHFVAIQSAPGRALARAHGIDPEDPASFIFVDQGRAWTKSDGLIALGRRLRAPGSWLCALRVLPRPIRDWLYDRLARHRYRWFGRRATCMVPDPAVRHRFVLPPAPGD